MLPRHSIRTVVLVLVCHVFHANSHPLKCKTPDATDGECISLNGCPSLLSLAKSPNTSFDQIFYLLQSKCNNNDVNPLVCCPITNEDRTTKTLHLLLPHLEEIETKVRLPALTVCGKQLFKVLGGNDTGIDEFPWMALLEYEKKNSSVINFACGGTLITARHVITAAHCVSAKYERILGKLISVRLGEYNIDTEFDCIDKDECNCADSPIDVQIEQIVIHPNYNETKNGKQHDIALLKLARSVKFTDFITPLCLPKNLSDVIHESGHLQYIAGWGQTEYGRNSAIKQKAGVRLVDHLECADIYKKYGATLGPKQICAGGDGTTDSCLGDSGGPLMVLAISRTTQEPIWFMTGIVSMGPNPCAIQGVPGVYTKVYDYINWIEQNI